MTLAHPMLQKLWFLIPEMTIFVGVVVVFIMGLSPSKRVRELLPLITSVFLGLGLVLTPLVYESETGRIYLQQSGFLLLPMLGKYVKMVVCGIGIILAMTTVGMIDRRLESAMASGRIGFDPIRANRGEFYAFFMLSLMGVMLVCNANDLIWLFLALELTSLPTYIMVAISRPSRRAQEAAVKYFFLGAMATAVFLYGFALLYGSTGTMILTEMREAFHAQAIAGARSPGINAGINVVGIIGMILALVGVSFKIAAAPMHFYAADVYEGAASPVTAFLAFVPKTAGFIAIILLLSTLGWSFQAGADQLPQPILITLWMIAVLAMTLGNVGAILQKSVKRVLAYSSIAHSGYMLIGIIAGPAHDGINAVLFYLLAYGVMNTAAFTVLAGLERKGVEIESMEDLAGLRVKHPVMAIVMALASGSLLGIPPLLGFFGKLYLFIAGVEAGQIPLVVIAGLNSAISAWYYLRLIAMPIMSKPSAQAETIVSNPHKWPRIAGIVTAIAVVALPLLLSPLFKASEDAGSAKRAVAGVSRPIATAEANAFESDGMH